MHLVDIVLPLALSKEEGEWKKRVALSLQINPNRIMELRIVKHSIDARKAQIKVQLRLEVGVDEKLLPEPKIQWQCPVLPKNTKTVVIIGFGPAGIFAALEALKMGIKPIVLDRGKDVFNRRFDLPKIQKGVVVEDSNYCFGEGGAGTFSDGKLYTRATKRGSIRDVYETLVAHGAPTRILVDSHPHIGSNKLPKVVMNMRKTILESGGQVHFNERVIDFEIKNQKITSVITQNNNAYHGDAVILATGHSGRDIYELLIKKNILLEPKPFAMGVRIEHPQPLIDQIQYHLKPGQTRDDLLPAARYSLATKIEGRGVHSFCMCPGGFIMPTATMNDEVVVNGMSLSKRDSPYANSGLVVSVEVEDTRPFQDHGVLAGIFFQKDLEIKAKQFGGGGQTAPAQRLVDFLEGKTSQTLPSTSYKPGIQSTRLDEIMPQWVVDRMQKGFSLFGKKMRGYISFEAVMIGFETRTSSPVRIPRNPDTLRHPQIENLLPCGEGAGYAGGIVSAAIDGIRCMQKTQDL